MAGVTVTGTGGSGQPPVKLFFDDAGRTAAEAKSLSYAISKDFAGSKAEYVDSNHWVGDNGGAGNFFSQAAASGQGYIVIESASKDYVKGFEAVTVTTGATVFGGASDGQKVLSQGDLTYNTNYGGGTIVVSKGNNTIGLNGANNTVYGGSGSDTINISPEGSSPSFGGVSVVYAGSGKTMVNLASGAGSVSVVGAAESTTATLVVKEANQAGFVDGAFGSVTVEGAAGTVVGGSAGSNNIIGSNAAAVTIMGGGVSDFIEGNYKGTEINIAGGYTTVAGSVLGTVSSPDQAIVNVHTGSETINGGFGTASIAVGAAAGSGDSTAAPVTIAGGGQSFTLAGDAIVINGGDGASTIAVDVSNQTSIAFTAGLGDVNYYGSSVDGSAAVIKAGAGTDYIAAGAGNTTLIAGTGFSMLNVGAGSDSIIGSTAKDAHDVFGFTQAAAHQHYFIDNFHVGDTIYVATAAEETYILNNQAITGSGATAVDTVTFQNGATVALSGKPTQLTSTDIKHL